MARLTGYRTHPRLPDIASLIGALMASLNDARSMLDDYPFQRTVAA
jgi:hypothetical protein